MEGRPVVRFAAVVAILVACICLLLGGCAKKTYREEMTKDEDMVTETLTIDDEVIERLEREWATDYLTAIGYGAVPPGSSPDGAGRSLARDAALVVAYDELYQQMGEVKITSDITVLNAAVKSHRTLELQGTIKGAEVIEDRWDADKDMYVISLRLPQKTLARVLRTWVK